MKRKLLTGLVIVSLTGAILVGCGNNKEVTNVDESQAEASIENTGETEDVEATEAHEHEWIAATMDAPETCKVCGETRGEKLNYAEAEGISFGEIKSLDLPYGVLTGVRDTDGNINFWENTSDFCVFADGLATVSAPEIVSAASEKEGYVNVTISYDITFSPLLMDNIGKEGYEVFWSAPCYKIGDLYTGQTLNEMWSEEEWSEKAAEEIPVDVTYGDKVYSLTMTRSLEWNNTWGEWFSGEVPETGAHSDYMIYGDVVGHIVEKISMPVDYDGLVLAIAIDLDGTGEDGVRNIYAKDDNETEQPYLISDGESSEDYYFIRVSDYLE